MRGDESDVYVDDGKTGTDTDREDFQRLLANVYSWKINCVIVKDLSRLSRNYTDAGNLIENLFVRLNIRFISLAEGVDSYRNQDSVSNIIVPITNVMNDQYCYQTSKKIRQVFDMKRRNGEFIGSYAPYGYIKDPQDKHALLVDPEAAEVVKSIFSMFLSGKNKRGGDHPLPQRSRRTLSHRLQAEPGPQIQRPQRTGQSYVEHHHHRHHFEKPCLCGGHGAGPPACEKLQDTHSRACAVGRMVYRGKHPRDHHRPGNL